MRAQVKAAETELGAELCARLQLFQDRYDTFTEEFDSRGSKHRSGNAFG
ncbi:hypothetical protein [Streptomyces microflavus]